uniref:Hexosyltransferase n=1 Tax=Fundulus heteroclitus TaxID=8078 RepID=A0A3Q2Q8L7_FUNHE
MRRLALFLLPCAVAVLVHLWLAQRPSFSSFFFFFTPLDNSTRSVLVGVLSARHHHDLRQAIRDTWLGYIRGHPHFQHRVAVKFIVGRHGCPVSDEDREDPYSCSLLNFSKPGEIKRSGSADRSAEERPLQRAAAVRTVLFASRMSGPLVSIRVLKHLDLYFIVFIQGFEGTLVWESQDSASLTTVNSSSVELNDGGGVLKISSVSIHITKEHCTLIYLFIFVGLKFHKLRREDAALQEESLRHGDMVFVDVVDTYRNVPSKLLQFYKWSVGNADFDLLLKTDDDCYIDVDSVLMKIDHKGLKRRNFWWGNFRQSWAVDRIGKWQELEYASPAYPAFACGSGYVVSRDLVRWLAANAGQLKAYQGEDVSMGIWMAAVGPQKYQDAGWLCEKDCYLDMLSSPQHTAEELRVLWDRKSICRDPCGCPWDP